MRAHCGAPDVVHLAPHLGHFSLAHAHLNIWVMGLRYVAVHAVRWLAGKEQVHTRVHAFIRTVLCMMRLGRWY